MCQYNKQWITMCDDQKKWYQQRCHTRNPNILIKDKNKSFSFVCMKLLCHCSFIIPHFFFSKHKLTAVLYCLVVLLHKWYNSLNKIKNNPKQKHLQLRNLCYSNTVAAYLKPKMIWEKRIIQQFDKFTFNLYPNV